MLERMCDRTPGATRLTRVFQDHSQCRLLGYTVLALTGSGTPMHERSVRLPRVVGGDGLLTKASSPHA